MSVTLKQLGSGIGRTATERIQFITRNEFVTEAKVRDLDVHFTIQEKIFCFQISVDDFLLVAILYGRHDLEEKNGWINKFCKKSLDSSRPVEILLWPPFLSSFRVERGNRILLHHWRIPWPGTTSSPSQSLGKAWQCWDGPTFSWSALRGTVSVSFPDSIGSCQWFWSQLLCQLECVWRAWLWQSCLYRWSLEVGIFQYAALRLFAARKLGMTSCRQPEKRHSNHEIMIGILRKSSTLERKETRALGLGKWCSWLVFIGRAWAVGGTGPPMTPLMPADDLLGVGGKHLGVGMTLPILSLVAVSSPAGWALMTFMIFAEGLWSRLSRTGLVRFSGGLEYWMSSGAGTGDPKLALEYLWLLMDLRSRLFWLAWSLLVCRRCGRLVK